MTKTISEIERIIKEKVSNLLNGNINSVTKFKLFLPGTRNSDNEIYVAQYAMLHN